MNRSSIESRAFGKLGEAQSLALALYPQGDDQVSEWALRWICGAQPLGLLERLPIDLAALVLRPQAGPAGILRRDRVLAGDLIPRRLA